MTTLETPLTLFDDPEGEARWRARFSAARMSRPVWAKDAPDRNVYVSNASGVSEVYAWDRVSDAHRQITNRSHGTSEVAISRDGTRIWWFDDTAGDEFGDWVSEPFGGEGPKVRPAVAGTHPGYPAGLAVGHNIVALGTDTDEGTTIWVARNGGPGEVIYASEHTAAVCALSRDERYLAIGHTEHGDARHPAVRVLSATDGTAVAEKWDGKGKTLEALKFAPIAGDPRLLVGHERRGRDELLIWDISTDTETVLELDLPGDITADWFPDGTALLVLHTFQARNTLHRYDLATGQLSIVDSAPGVVGSAAVRDDGAIEYTWSSAAHPPLVRTVGADGVDRELCTPPGPRAPEAFPVTDVFVPGPGGAVHALIARPTDAEDGRLPTVFSVHGGPHSADDDHYSAYRALWVDAGFAVIQVNYRGSTGYGSAWRRAIEGRPGHTELADIAAVYDWAIAEGIADPARCVVEGASWGGYVALLALGTQPDRWAAGVAQVPIADYVTAYADEMEPVREFDRSLFGGSPDDLPDLYRDSSPITYVDQVRAPVLVTAGENDPRCPVQQIDNYLDRLAARDAPHSVYRYDAGHHSLVVAETLKQSAIAVTFVRQVLSGQQVFNGR